VRAIGTRSHIPQHFISDLADSMEPTIVTSGISTFSCDDESRVSGIANFINYATNDLED